MLPDLHGHTLGFHPQTQKYEPRGLNLVRFN